MYRQEDCATMTQIVGKTNETIELVSHFWSKDQFNVLNSKMSSYNKIAFTSGFGTGKTITLMAKAMELLENKENVVIVIFEGNNDKTLLRIKFEKHFEGTNAIIKGISGTKG
jgi:hypothetical protein